ncbi:MAG: hypothetical protein CMG75_01800 [Candidatus Marinimicrobia bacterium]|nr:hypothetical protein [Candidatus Neomarinimicrobiota bacterium]|tara:strand:+ start:6448 stop:6876 length:429 start_codon:yes stop_codon:yes gene_type:complete
MVEEQEVNVDAQKEFLMAKINQLTDGIAPGYGEEFLEELMRRLEKTVADFNDEVTTLLDMLKSQSAERNEKLKELIEKGEENISESKKPSKTAAEEEMSDWEKRLEAQGDSPVKETISEKKSKKEEKPAKKGFFRRKKKNSK